MGYVRIPGMKKSEVERKYSAPVENQDSAYCYSEGFHVFYADGRAPSLQWEIGQK